MNDQEYANDYKTGCMHETAEFLGSLREVVPEHQHEAADGDGGDGRYHGPGKKLLADVEFAEPGVPEGNIVDPQAFDSVEKSCRAPAVFRPDCPASDIDQMNDNKGDGHDDEKQCRDTVDDAGHLQAHSQPLAVRQARGGQVRIHAPNKIVRYGEKRPQEAETCRKKGQSGDNENNHKVEQMIVERTL